MRLEIFSEKCTGCQLCGAVCSARLVRNFNPSRAAVYIESLLPDARAIVICVADSDILRE